MMLVTPMMNSAHDRDPAAWPWRPHGWNSPTASRPFRRCSYCGSVHPHDLLTMLEAGSSLELADEKHGWPHKFYTPEYHKFYSIHLLDARENFGVLSNIIRLHTGISFEKEASGELAYRRPTK